MVVVVVVARMVDVVVEVDELLVVADVVELVETVVVVDVPTRVVVLEGIVVVVVDVVDVVDVVEVVVEVVDVDVAVDVVSPDSSAGALLTGSTGTISFLATSESSRNCESKQLPSSFPGAKFNARATAAASTARPSWVRCTRSPPITPGVAAIEPQSSTVMLS